MKSRKKLLVLVVGIILISAGIIYFVFATLFHQAPKKISQEVLPEIYSNSMFYDEGSFRKAINEVENIAPQDNIYSLITPHHLLASEFIAGTMRRASGREIKRIFVVGPNHENIGTSKIATAAAAWQTPLGEVQADSELVTKFASQFDLKPDLNVFEAEHSVGAMAPLIKYYFPEAKIVPIVFSSYATEEDARQVSDWLADNFGEGDLLVISIDFSHYLTKEKADQSDVITRDLILAKDIKRIVKLDNDYVDSPISLATSLLFAEKERLKTNIIYNSNSFNFSVIKPSSTTSYFGIIFTK